MIAGGEMMHGISVFLLVALVPTGLTLWFLRRHRPTWSVFTVACLAVAEAAALLEGTGDERHLALTRGSLGLACVRLGDTAAARRSLASALALASGLAAEREAAYALEAAAELAAASGEPERAVRWMGCADAVRERIGSPRSPAEREEQEALMSRLRAALGMDRAKATGEQGAAAGLDATVREALAALQGQAEKVSSAE